jgi:hypothetical protein
MEWFLFIAIATKVIGGEPLVAKIPMDDMRTCFHMERMVNKASKPLGAVPTMMAWCYAVPKQAKTSSFGDPLSVMPQQSAKGKRDMGGVTINGQYPIDIPIDNPYTHPWYPKPYTNPGYPK